jgi:hypothetical protein
VVVSIRKWIDKTSPRFIEIIVECAEQLNIKSQIESGIKSMNKDIDIKELVQLSRRQADLFGDGHAGWAKIADQWQDDQIKEVITDNKIVCLPSAIAALRKEAMAIVDGNARRRARNVPE